MAGQVSVQRKWTFRGHSSLGIAGAVSGVFMAAFAGATVWGQVALLTGYELAWLAVGVGVCTGLAARVLTSNEQSISVQMLAASAALIGVVAGKYYVFAIFLKEAIEGAFGAQVAAEYTLFSSTTFNFLKADTGAILGPLDAVWLGIAMFVAWRIPQSINLHWGRKRSD